MPIRSHIFDNGLTFVYQKSTTQLSSINIFIKVGSADEPKTLFGGAHFIEHALFKGTASLPTSSDITTIFDSHGSYINAFTSHEMTYLSVKTHSDNTEVCLNTLFDIIQNSILDPSELEKEKKIVIEEISRAHDNTGVYNYEKIYQLLYKNTVYSHPIGGTPEGIRKYNNNELLSFYRAHYTPDNIVVSICSNINYTDLTHFIRKSTLGKNTKRCARTDPTSFIVQTEGPYGGYFENRNLAQTHIACGFKVCGRNGSDIYALAILKIILAGNMSSILFVKLREENGLTYNISIDLDMFRDIGVFILSTSVEKKSVLSHGDQKGALNIIMDTLVELYHAGITETQLTLAKGYLKGILTLSNEDSSNRSEHAGVGHLFKDKDKDIPLSKLYLKKYHSLTIQDINQVLRKYFVHTHFVSSYIGSDVISKREDIIKCEKHLLNNTPLSKNIHTLFYKEST